MWEGKALVFLDAPLQLLGFGFGLFSLFSSSPSAPDYTPYLDQVRSPKHSAFHSVYFLGLSLLILSSIT